MPDYSVYQGFTVEIKGLDEIEKRLQALPEKIRRKYIRTALKEGSDLILEEARSKVKRSQVMRHPKAGHLADAIVSRISVGMNSASARVGVDYKKVSTGHLVEFGTKPHQVGLKVKSGPRKGQRRIIRFSDGTFRFAISEQHPGARKQPFMRPAYDAKGDEALNIMLTMLAQAVEKEV